MTQNNIHAYTVKELRDELNLLITEGMGERIVLIPDTDTIIPGDYRTIDSIDIKNRSKRCIYFKTNSDEDEEQFWREE